MVRRTEARIKAFVNISSIGLVAPEFELSQPSYLDVDLLGRSLAGNLDFVVGIKVRMASPTVGSTGLLALHRALEAASEHELPIMVHIADAPPEIGDVLALLRPGDIVTHCCTGGSMKLVNAAGAPLDSARAALDRGIILDVGHGAGSLNFASAAGLLSAGIMPHVISTDLHQMSLHVGSLVSSDAVESPVIQLAGGHRRPARPAAVHEQVPRPRGAARRRRRARPRATRPRPSAWAASSGACKRACPPTWGSSAWWTGPSASPMCRATSAPGISGWSMSRRSSTAAAWPIPAQRTWRRGWSESRRRLPPWLNCAWRVSSKTYSLGAWSPSGTSSLTVADGELVVLVGPSGCGKSTILRMISRPGAPVTRRTDLLDRRPRSTTD